MKTALALISLCAMLSGCVTGSHIVTGTPRPAVLPDAVRIYGTAPEQCEIIGTVNAASELNGQGATDDCMKELRKQAAKIGANGLIFGTVARTPGNPTFMPVMGSTPVFVPGSPGTSITGTAIFVP